jgi:hypothetical protein
MGQLFQPAEIQATYPDRAAELDRSECVLLIALRWWVEAYRTSEDPVPRLTQGLDIAGAPDAALSIDALMRTVARTARRPIDIHCPRCPGVSGDEAQLLHAVSLIQAGESAQAERMLCRELLSSNGASFALGPLEGLGEVFASAHLILRRRRLAPTYPQLEPASWAPGHAGTLH